MRVLPAEQINRTLPHAARVLRRAPEAFGEDMAAPVPASAGRALVPARHGMFFRHPDGAGTTAGAHYLAQEIGQAWTEGAWTGGDRAGGTARAAAAYERADAFGGTAIVLEFAGARLTA